MVRIAHLADTHLGYKQYNLDEREKDIYNALDEIGNRIIEEHADIVIHSGDLFDSPRPTPQAYRAFKNFLNKISGKAKVFTVLGDHDRPKSRGIAPHVLFDDQIQILGVGGRAENQELRINGKDILVAGLSNLSCSYRSILLEELNALSSINLENKLGILVLHEAIDKFLPYEGAFELTLKEIPKNFDYVAMGHLHSRIKVAMDEGELAYPGSSEIISKTEISGWQTAGKGFYVVDCENEHVSIQDVNIECIRPQIEAKLKYSRLDTDLPALTNRIKEFRKLPIVHVLVEGKNIDRQDVYQILNASLSKLALSFRQEVSEDSEMNLPELKRGAFNVNQVIQDYFKDKTVAALALELWKYLRYGDSEEAKKVAEDYFDKVTKN